MEIGCEMDHLEDRGQTRWSCSATLRNIHSIARDWLLYPSLTAKPGGVPLREAEAECRKRQ